MYRRPWAVFPFILLVFVGCGADSSFPTAKVKGKVLFAGQPVTGGELTFAPTEGAGLETGKPATAAIQPDGSFVLSTYGDEDGAVVGKHLVLFAAPPGELPLGKTDWDPGEEPSKSRFAGLAPADKSVEIKEGGNDLLIELVAAQP